MDQKRALFDRARAEKRRKLQDLEERYTRTHNWV